MNGYSIIEGAEVQIESLYRATKAVVKKVELRIGGLALVLFLSAEVPFAIEDSADDSQDVLVESVIRTVSESEVRGARLQDSLSRHKGNLLSTEQHKAFRMLVDEIKALNFKDALARYNDKAKHITCDLLMDDGLLVHITQYFEEPTDNIVYSVEREADFLRTGYAPLDGFRIVVRNEVEAARQMLA